MVPVFHAPGVYHITAFCQTSAGARVESEPIAVRVLEPPESAKAVVEAVGRLGAIEPLYDHRLFWKFEGAKEELRDFVARFPGTLYADYARLSLARSYLGKALMLRRAEDRLRPGSPSRAELIADARALIEAIRPEGFTMQRELKLAREMLERFEGSGR